MRLFGGINMKKMRAHGAFERKAILGDEPALVFKVRDDTQTIFSGHEIIEILGRAFTKHVMGKFSINNIADCEGLKIDIIFTKR